MQGKARFLALRPFHRTVVLAARRTCLRRRVFGAGKRNADDRVAARKKPAPLEEPQGRSAGPALPPVEGRQERKKSRPKTTAQWLFFFGCRTDVGIQERVGQRVLWARCPTWYHIPL